MEFNTNIPEWKNEGTEPSSELKTNGFQGGYKPPAAVFNWFWSLVQKAIKEIQSNLSKVDNTSDSEKSVKFASEAGTGRKVKNPLILRFKGGENEGVDLWNYDGSVSKSVNITPRGIGARPLERPNIVVTAIREERDDGKEVYAVIDSDIVTLYDGLEITIIPNETNTTTSPRLAINNLGDNGIRLPLSFNCAATTTVKANYFSVNRPVTLKYHANLNLGVQGQGAWIFADRQKTSAQDLYGNVPIESGGTGADTLEDARQNLGIGAEYVKINKNSLAQHSLSDFDYIIARGIYRYGNTTSEEVITFGSLIKEETSAAAVFCKFEVQGFTIEQYGLYLNFNNGVLSNELKLISYSIPNDELTEETLSCNELIGVKVTVK